MKKTKKTLLTAAILTAGLNFTSCEEPQDVYGPPVDMESSTSSTTTYDPYSDSFQPEYGVPEYEPVTEQETTEQSATTTETTESDEYMPEYNPLDEEPQDVYGPPPDLD